MNEGMKDECEHKKKWNTCAIVPMFFFCKSITHAWIWKFKLKKDFSMDTTNDFGTQEK